MLGRRALLVEHGVEVEAHGPEDASQVWVAREKRCLGYFTLRDQPRREARDALLALRELGIDRFILLTGDRAAAAREVGAALGMDEVIAGPKISRSDMEEPITGRYCETLLLLRNSWRLPPP